MTERGVEMSRLGLSDSKLSKAKILLMLGVCGYCRYLESRGWDIWEREIEESYDKKLKASVIKLKHDEDIARVCIDSAMSISGISGANSTKLRAFFRSQIIPKVIDHYRYGSKHVMPEDVRSLDDLVDVLLDPSTPPAFHVEVFKEMEPPFRPWFPEGVPTRCGLFDFFQRTMCAFEGGVLGVPFNDLFMRFVESGVFPESVVKGTPNPDSYWSKIALRHTVSLQVLASMGSMLNIMNGRYFEVHISEGRLANLLLGRVYQEPVQRDLVVFGSGLDGFSAIHECVGIDRVADFLRIERFDGFRILHFDVKGELSAKAMARFLSGLDTTWLSEGYEVVIMNTLSPRLQDMLARIIDRAVHLIPPDVDTAERVRLYGCPDETTVEDICQAINVAMELNIMGKNPMMAETDEIVHRIIMSRIGRIDEGGELDQGGEEHGRGC